MVAFTWGLDHGAFSRGACLKQNLVHLWFHTAQFGSSLSTTDTSFFCTPLTPPKHKQTNKKPPSQKTTLASMSFQSMFPWASFLGVSAFQVVKGSQEGNAFHLLEAPARKEGED